MRFLSLGGLLFLFCHALTYPQSATRLSLNEAIKIAQQHNPEIHGARRGIEAARGRFWRGIAPPPASLSVSYDFIPRGSGINMYGERTLGISQSFDFPTTIALRGSSLSSETDATEADFRMATLSITTQVKLAYYAVLAKQQKLSLAEENLGIADDFSRIATIRNDVGEGTNLEKLTAAVQRTQADNAVELARNELTQAAGELSVVLGQGREQERQAFELTDSLAHQSPMVLLDSLIEQADMDNPKLQSARFRLTAASVNRTIAWSSVLPSFTLSYSRQVQGGSRDLYGVAFGVSLPIWFLLDQRGHVQEASATYAKMESELTAKRNSVHMDVKNAYLDVMNDERQVQLCQTALLPQAREVYRAAVTSYQAGEISYLEFLQAKQTMISTRSMYIDAMYHFNVAFAQLDNAVGRTLGE